MPREMKLAVFTKNEVLSILLGGIFFIETLSVITQVVSFKLTGRMANMAAVDALEAGGPARMQPGFTARAEDNVSPLNLDVMTYDN